MPVWNFGQPLDGIIQIAFIVPDIKAAMPVYAERLKIGPWFLFEHFEFDRVSYRGAPSGLDVSLCLGYSGHMMFELIEQHDDGPSAYSEIRDQRGYGFHHFAVSVEPDDYDRKLSAYQDQGYDVVLDGAVKVGGRATYLDTSQDLGGMIEMIEMTPQVEALFSLLHQESRLWDGADPIRQLT
ncbi:MAG: VOC family protein [Pseudomonadota bacterium]